MSNADAKAHLTASRCGEPWSAVNRQGALLESCVDLIVR
jgi:hypothetical protein